ncbi:UNVERIFIED_CONTAM: Thioredoxin-like fold domain-containing protein MRL7L, chloroplastic [Sesamum calycinum]|uniref:Thioredoxin-like fold domain-containing protein MRL7L, chloroplastic n=1 Tax=Sesamum calycinum TaxID=2727403 RepID=A0AAW2RRC0_9LAMI
MNARAAISYSDSANFVMIQYFLLLILVYQPTFPIGSPLLKKTSSLKFDRPKENEKIRDELEKAVHIIWNCRLPSPRSLFFPELIFTKAGKILYREKSIRTADELSKIMAFYYYGAAKPPCLSGVVNMEEAIPTVEIRSEHP